MMVLKVCELWTICALSHKVTANGSGLLAVIEFENIKLKQMNRKELEDQMRDVLIPVAPHGWLVDRCCDLAELYAQKQLLQQTPCTTQLLPVARIYSFAKWIASEDFDWHYVESDDLWKKDGWCSRTTAELLELYSRQ